MSANICAKISLPLNRSGPTSGSKAFANRFRPFDARTAFGIPAARFEHVVSGSASGIAVGPTSSGLFNLCLYAFAEEKPVLITPDNVYLHILQRVAEHVNLNSEALKSKFLTDAAAAAEGKQTIVIINDALRQGSADSPWHEVFPEFRAALASRIVDGQVPTIDFSSTTAVDQTCQTVALMDMLQAYFNFEVHTRCGIPEIALGGTAEDWTLLVINTVALLKRVEMDWWLVQLQPILEHFQSVACGNVADLAFWSTMIRLFAEQSGSGPAADGWITKLFPYLKRRDGSGVDKNTFVETGWKSMVPFDALPSSVSKVPFVWEYLGTRINMLFVAGAVGVELEEDQKTDQKEDQKGGEQRLCLASSYAIVYDEDAARAPPKSVKYGVPRAHNSNY
jgi:hypothetical protein